MEDVVFRRKRSEHAAFVVGKLQEIVPSLNPASRFMRMKKVLSGDTIPYGHRDFPIAAEAERDLQIMGFAVDQFLHDGADVGFRELFRRAIKDSVLPQQDVKNSEGRDHQFHLYLASVAQAAGLFPEHKEPDVVCTVDGQRFGIAAKRIKSINQLGGHVKYAAEKQIKKSGLPGVIALDLTRPFNKDNVVQTSRWYSENYEFFSTLRLWTFLTKNKTDLLRWTKDTGTIGLAIFDWNVLLRHDGEWGLSGNCMWLETFPEGDHESKALHDGFFAAFDKGVPNRKRSTIAGAARR
jgi:hypothetical protein